MFQVSGSGFRVSGFGFRISGFGFQFPVLGFRVSGSGFRVSGFGFRVPGFGFRVSGLEFRVSGFWFLVSSSGVLWQAGERACCRRRGTLISDNVSIEWSFYSQLTHTIRNLFFLFLVIKFKTVGGEARRGGGERLEHGKW